jgi:hemolysin activation/secretion protein
MAPAGNVSGGGDRASSTGSAAGAATRTAAPLTFEVGHYEIQGDTLLSTETLMKILLKYTGTNVSIADIVKAAGELQMEYRNRGYPTVNVAIPQQSITNGMVKFRVFMGYLAEILVTRNRHFSSNNVMRALPSLQPGIILNRQVFQAELDRANANRDRQIFPELQQGPQTNTSTCVLEVKDRVPLHARVEFNNKSTPGTSDERVSANISYDNLWQREHSLGFQYGFTPESFKSEDVPGIPMNTLDAPAVAYYSLFYRAPLTGPEGLDQAVQEHPTQFGYNEATRQFVLPPPTGVPELSVYGTRSTTDTTLYGVATTAIDSTLEKIELQSASRNVTRDHTVGARLTWPVRGSEHFNSGFSFGFDYKDHIGAAFPSSIIYSTITSTNKETGLPVVTYDKKVIPGNATRQQFSYLPLSLAWNGTEVDKQGVASVNLSYVFCLGGPFSGQDSFTNATSSSQADGRFLTLHGRLSREQRLFGQWKLLVSAEGQWASQPLVSLEQFGIGGMSSVRGYQEGELYGDHGWNTQVEFHTPTFTGKYLLDGHATELGVSLSAFMDYGRVYLIDPQGRKPSSELWGAGLGARVILGSHLEGQFALAWPLTASPNRKALDTRVTFALSAQF